MTRYYTSTGWRCPATVIVGHKIRTNQYRIMRLFVCFDLSLAADYHEVSHLLDFLQHITNCAFCVYSTFSHVSNDLSGTKAGVQLSALQ